MKAEMALSGCYGQYECFSVVDFKADLKAQPRGDGMIVLTQGHMEQEYARSKFMTDMNARGGLLIVADSSGAPVTIKQPVTRDANSQENARGTMREADEPPADGSRSSRGVLRPKEATPNEGPMHRDE